MRVGFDTLIGNFARLALVLTMALGTSACSSIPTWVDPTTWVGGGGEPAADPDQTPGESPDLADTPDRPTPTTTADEQQQVSDSLAADRTKAKYSSDALRGATEPTAAPPPPASAAPPPQQTAVAEPPAPSAAAPSAPAPDTAPPPPAPAATELPPAAPAPTASSAPPPPPPRATAMVSPSDAQLGFKPSTAPPLDPTVTQFATPQAVARYRQTASASAGMQVASVAPRTGAMPAGSYTNPQGMTPTAVVYFPGDGTLLSPAGRAQVHAAVEAFKAAGGQGYLRVVGHSSSRTANMPVEKHLVAIFNKSQDRANAVAKEAIREGVPASKVLVEAVGDSQPVYYESMPKGEDGNRRAEIFLQS